MGNFVFFRPIVVRHDQQTSRNKKQSTPADCLVCAHIMRQSLNMLFSSSTGPGSGLDSGLGLGSDFGSDPDLDRWTYLRYSHLNCPFAGSTDRLALSSNSGCQRIPKGPQKVQPE